MEKSGVWLEISRFVFGAFNLVFILFASAIDQPALAQNPHPIIRPSLIYVVGSGTTDIGTAVSSQGTATMISDDGYIITSFHLLSKLRDIPLALGRLKPETVTFQISVGEKKTYPDRPAAVVNAIPETDLLLLKTPEGATPYTAAQIGISTDLSVLGIGTTVYTSGFPEASPDIAYSDQVSSKNGPGGFSWLLSKAPSSGQSGSPIYNEAGKLIGIMKGDISGNAGAFIPIELAQGLLAPMKFRVLERRMQDLTSAVLIFQCILSANMAASEVLLQIRTQQDLIERNTATLALFTSKESANLSTLERSLKSNATRSLEAARDELAKAQEKAQEVNISFKGGMQCNVPK